MKFFFGHFLLLFVSINAFAQTGDWIFQPIIDRPYYESTNHANYEEMITDFGTGESYIFSTFQDTINYNGTQYISKNRGYDLLLIKLDETGQLIWAKQMGGAGFDFASSIAFHQGNLLIATWYRDSTIINNVQYFAKDGQALLIKINKSDASFMDVKQFNIKGSIATMSVSNTNEVYLAGVFTTNSSFGSFDLPNPRVTYQSRTTFYNYYAKLDQNLSPIWVKHTEHNSCCAIPRIKKMKINPFNGNIIYMGTSYGAVGFEQNYVSGRGSEYSFIVSYSSAGNFLWSQVGQSAADITFSDVEFTDFDINDKGETYVVGNYNHAAELGNFIIPNLNEEGYRNGFVAKLNPKGQYVWAKPIVSDNSPSISSIECRGDDCYFSGYFRMFLAFDQLTIVDSIPFPLTMGYIGKIEEGDKMNKLLILESSEYSAANHLSENKSGFINLLGVYQTDISVGCLKSTNVHWAPFAARIDVNDDIEVPVISGASKTCKNELYSLNIDNYDPNYKYTAVTPEGVSFINQSGNTIQLKVLDSAPDTIRINVIASNICNWRAASNQLKTINNSPELDGEIATPGLLCAGNPGLVFSASTGKKIINYHWSLPEGISASGNSNQNEIHILINDAFNNGTVQLYGSNGCGNTDTISKFISKEPELELTGEIIMPDLLCEGSESLVSTSSTNEKIESYHWIFPEGSSINGNLDSKEVQVKFNLASKNEVVELYGSNVCGNSDTLSKEITVISQLPAPELNGEPIICISKTNIYQALLDDALIGDITYLWEVSDGLVLPNGSKNYTSPSDKVIIKANAESIPEKQWIRLSASNMCSTSPQAYKEITGADVPALPQLAIDECDQQIEVATGDDFEWYFNDEKILESATILNSIDSGFYQVRSYNICGETWSEPVTTNPVIMENLTIPNVITPNGDAYNQQFVIDQSLQQASLVIYNRWGQEVYKNDSYTNDWDASNIPSGVYFYTLIHQCLSENIKGTLSVLR